MRLGIIVLALLVFGAPASAESRAGTAGARIVAVPEAAMPGGEAQAQGAQVVTPSAAELELEQRTREVASQLRCPVCQGVSIEDSPTDLARDMRNVIRDQLAAGRSPEEVKAYFISKYGEWVLLEPEPRGFNLAVYVLPILALAGGTGLVAASVRRWVRQGNEEPQP